MNYRLALIVFALIPLTLLESCSTRQTVQQSTAPRQTTGIREVAPSPSSVPAARFPRYGHIPGYGNDAVPGTFPRPQSLESQVGFWRDVYSTWSRSQVAIHDNLFLNVVYEVAQLPDFTREGMTATQKEFVRERMDYWRDRLNSLEAKISTGAPLDTEEHRLAGLLTQNDEGTAAIRGASERLRYQRGMRERFRRGLEISGMYDRRFREIFRKAGLPEDLVYLPHVESSFQANARSSAGALGIWQFTPGAARMFMNGDDSVRNRLDPIASAQGAARYLSYAYDKLGSWPLAVTSYNHGIGGMQRAKNLYGHNFTRIVKDYDHPLFGFASRNYYAEFLAAREIASQPDVFFPEGVRYAQDSDWTLSRLASSEDERVALPRPVTPKFAQPPLKMANVADYASTRFSSAKARKVSLREIAKSKRPDVRAMARTPKTTVTASRKSAFRLSQSTRSQATKVAARHANAGIRPASARRTSGARLVTAVGRQAPAGSRSVGGPQKIARR